MNHQIQYDPHFCSSGLKGGKAIHGQIFRGIHSFFQKIHYWIVVLNMAYLNYQFIFLGSRENRFRLCTRCTQRFFDKKMASMIKQWHGNLCMKIGWTNHTYRITLISQFLQAFKSSTSISLFNLEGSLVIGFIKPNKFAGIQLTVDPYMMLAQVTNPCHTTGNFFFSILFHHENSLFIN